ncbi:SMI1/KNR4 family protein [Emticicia soli]|uniref:SMI1/KNR4 family protein n=1 Tax=Emticicia soli TaxID=2027878 RepID=A0ABW5JBV4_9BACT
MKYLNELPEWFIQDKDNIGCTKEEIEEMEEFYGFSFPEAYKELLSLMGKKPAYAYFLQGFCYWNYKFMKEYSKEILAIYNESFGSVSQYEDSFIIIAMSDESFVLIKNNEGENPPVYLFYSDGLGSEIKKSHDFFSEYVKDLVPGGVS